MLPGGPEGDSIGLKLDRGQSVLIRMRSLRRSARWCARLRTGVNEGELQLELQPAVIHRALAVAT